MTEPQPLCTTQLSMKFIVLKNVIMETIVGIFTFNRIINATSQHLKVLKLHSL